MADPKDPARIAFLEWWENRPAFPQGHGSEADAMKADLGFAFKAGSEWAKNQLAPELEKMQLETIRLRDEFNVLANRYNLALDWAKRFAENPLGEVGLKKPENHG